MYQDILINLMISILSPFLAAFLATFLALKKFSSERWWEQKMKAYLEILENLSLIFFYYSSSWDDLADTTYMNKTIRSKMHEKYFEAKNVLIKYSASGSILISDESAKILKDYLLKHEMEIPNPLESVEAEPNYINKQLELIDLVIEKFKKAAKKEMKSKKLFKPIA